MADLPTSLLLGKLSTLMPEAMRWLKRMVDVNSFTANAEGVNRAGEITAECFGELGFAPEFVASDNPEHGRHLFLRRKPGQGNPVLLVTHLDTVFPPGEEARNNFHWKEAPAENRIYGPGTVDIKGGTVLIWMILNALRELDPSLFSETNWIIAANSSEEVMSADFDAAARKRCPAGARAVLVFEGGPREGSVYHIVTSRKGRVEYRITARGRAAHAGSSHADGVNAIVHLSSAVKAAAAVTDYASHLTVNVGRIHGGTVLNRVPHEAVAELEMRAYDPVVLQRARTLVEHLATREKETRDAQIIVECLGETPAWPADERNEKLFLHWSRAAAALGLAAKPVPRGGLSDANYLFHFGPTLDGLGPCGANAHCSERSPDGSKVPEFVEIDSFVPKAAMNVLALRGMLAGGENVA
jgi:glutamate carboxypeptidase